MIKTLIVSYLCGDKCFVMMIEIIFERLKDTNIMIVATWLILTYAATMGACIIDLLAGVHKAKQAGLARTSTGLRKTCIKMQHYFLPMLCLSFADFLASAFLAFPPFSMLWAAFCCTCEFKSVLEKSTTKKEIRDAANTMGVVIKNKDDIANILLEVLKQQAEDKPKKKNKRLTKKKKA